MQCSGPMALQSKFGYCQPGHTYDRRGASSHHLNLSPLIYVLLSFLHPSLQDSKPLPNCTALGLVARPWKTSSTPAQPSKYSCAQLPSLPVPCTNLSPFVPSCYGQSRSISLSLPISWLVDGNEFCKSVSWLGFLDCLPALCKVRLRRS